jgi:flavin-binding protein dodecin
MAAAKTIEIIGRSTQGSDDAVRQALDEARRTVRHITGVDVVSKGLRGDDLSEWRALVRVAFVIDRDDEPPTESARRSAAAEAAALKLEEREAGA